jgi:hypothetical protein
MASSCATPSRSESDLEEVRVAATTTEEDERGRREWLTHMRMELVVRVLFVCRV